MKATLLVRKEVDVKRLTIDVPVNYEEEDIPNNFPFRRDDRWVVSIDLDEHRIDNWPREYGPTSIFMKVGCQGVYDLFNEDGEALVRKENDYVPNELLTGEYMDYINFKIDENGVITNSKDKPNFSDFREFDE